MYLFKENIFNDLYGKYEKKIDTNKDSEGKGTLQRFVEMLGADFDEELVPLINELLDNTLVPQTAMTRFLPYLEAMLGSTLSISGDEYIRRKFLANMIPLYKVKGTFLSFEMVFKLLGFSEVLIVEDLSVMGFDSPYTFDDPERVFDTGKCAPCSNYAIQLEGEAALDDDLSRVIFDIIRFIEPINARLTSVTYNDIVLEDKIISIFVADNGDLIYRNTNDPTLTLEVRAGDLLIDGPNKNKYTLDDNKNLKYNGGN